MIFTSKNNKHRVKSFVLKVSSGAKDKPVAYGPGSVVNGSIVIHVSKLQLVKKLKVVFQCTEYSGKRSNIIFSVESVLLGEHGTQVTELNAGNHMYLFAIKLPDVNYPPTLRDNYIDHKVDYTLQGFLDVAHPDQLLQTHAVHITYLPLVTCQPAAICSPIQRRKTYQKGDQLVQVNAELKQPAYCPGDMCTIEMITQNQSDFRITHVDLAFMSTTASHLSTSQSENARRNHTLYTQKYYTAITRRINEHHTLLQFRLPTSCPPSTQTHRHIDISYQIMMTVPLFYAPSSSPSSSSSSSTSTTIVSSLMISLPITVATVPYTAPPQLQIPLPSYQDSHINRIASDMPSFLDQHIDDSDSPLPSPVEGSWSDRCSVSPMMEESVVDWPFVPALTLDSISGNNNNNTMSQQDGSGHLMVPSTSRRRRSVSSSSSSSGVHNECSLEVNESAPSTSLAAVN
ncbi:hypothetical protein BC941DRAFT_427269 [Chlamydoabsidia padenii]|nr:hypothetical protein BC941DRAFT_427269 [Chlamydoabsidia padenii]